MSETKLYFGKLREIDLKGESIEEYCERKCKEQNIEKESFHDSWLDAWNDSISYNEVGTIFSSKNGFFEMIEGREEEDTEFIQHLKDNGDSTYDYIMMFYNGGTCLSEMIEEALDDIKVKEE